MEVKSYNKKFFLARGLLIFIISAFVMGCGGNSSVSDLFENTDTGETNTETTEVEFLWKSFDISESVIHEQKKPW